jgi:hypothetical protein
MDRDFTVLRALLYVLSTYVLWVTRDTKSDSAGIEHLGKTFFMDEDFQTNPISTRFL